MYNEISLADAVEFIVDNRGKTVPVQESGFPLIATNCISNENLYPEFSNLRYVSEEIYENWFRAHPEADDVILTNKGSKNGAICLVPDPVGFCIAQDMVALRAKKGVVYPKYLFAVLRSTLVQNRIKELNVDSVIPHFKKTDFNKLFFPLPDYDTQISIGDCFFSYCQKIQLNRQTNQTLEQIAQAIFKSWFVDFEPTRAKIAAKQTGQDPERAAMAAISGKPIEELGALYKNSPERYQQLKTTAALFPDVLVEPELGEVPEGWVWSEIGNEVSVVGGGTPSTKKEIFWDGGDIHWTSPKDMSNLTDKILLETNKKITTAGLAKISSGLLPVGTVLMSSRAPVGYLAITKIPVAINQGYIAMKCEGQLTPEYIVQWADSIMDDIKQRASGTTFAEISKKNFKIIPVIVPDQVVITEFSKIVSGLYGKITESLNETKSLTGARDSLLPKLLFGEVVPTFKEAV